MTISVAIRLNGQAAGLKLSIAAAGVITATLDSVAGVDTVAWEVIGTDETGVAATITAALVQSGIKGETVTFNALGVGTAGVLKATANGNELLFGTVKWFVPAANGLEVGAANEERESDATFGSTGLENAAIRGAAGGGGAGVPAARILTAGAGLTGGGDLSADRTFNVGAGAGVTVGANDVAVIYGAGGDLATVNAGDTASAGAIDAAARADHQHPVSTAAPSVTVVTDAGLASEGSAASLLRSDAQLLVKTAVPVSIGTGNSIGISDSVARANHVHDHGSQTTSTHHAVAVSGGANGFLSGTDKAKLDGVASSAAALGGATPLPPAVAAVVGASATGSHDDHVHPWGTASAGLVLNRPQHASGAGIKDAIRGQAAAAGANVGGKLEIGGGDAGNGTVAAGETLILLGEAPTGGISAALTICRSDGGANYLSVHYSDVLGRVVLDSASIPYLDQGLRIAGTLSHVPATLTSATTITMTEGTGNHRNVVLVHDTTFAAPTGFENGTELVLFVEQGAGAPWTAAWNAAFLFPTGMSGTLVGNALGEVDVFRFILRVDVWVCVTHESY